MHINKINFLTFYTQGAPLDNALSLEKEKDTLVKAIKPYVDSCTAISCNDLRENPETAIYVKPFETVASRNFKTNEIGFLRWKPYIILKELEKLDDGDIVFYRDCNVSKYKDILFDIPNIRENIHFILDYCQTDFYAPIESFPRLKMRSFVKQEVFDYFNIKEDNGEYLVNASIIIVKKSKRSIELLKQWLEACMNDDLLSPIFNEKINPQLKWNTQEQAILNGLLIKENIIDKWICFRGSRKLTPANFNLLPKTAVVLYGETEHIQSNIVNKLLGYINADIIYSGWSEQTTPDCLILNKLSNALSLKNNPIIKIDIESKYLWEESISKDQHLNYNVNDLAKLYKLCRSSAILKTLNNHYDLVFFINLNEAINQDIPVNFIREALNPTRSPQKIYSFTHIKEDFKNEIDLNFLWARNDVFHTVSSLWKDTYIAEKLYEILVHPNGEINVSKLMYYFSIQKKMIYQPTNHFD